MEICSLKSFENTQKSHLLPDGTFVGGFDFAVEVIDRHLVDDRVPSHNRGNVRQATLSNVNPIKTEELPIFKENDFRGTFLFMNNLWRYRLNSVIECVIKRNLRHAKIKFLECFLQICRKNLRTSIYQNLYNLMDAIDVLTLFD